MSLGKPSNNTSNNEIPAPIKKISYEVVQTWIIPNGGYGKLIVISKSDATAENFAVLAQQLKQEYSKDRNASISVFIDRRAAEIRNQVLHNTSEGITNSDTTFYENNYVAQYDKNGNTGYHKFQYWPNGLYNDWISIDL